MMKRIIIALMAIGGVALWWADAGAQTGCTGGVGIGGSCKTGGLFGRSLAGITRTIDAGKTSFEFFGTQGPGCTHDFANGVLDCDCRLRGTAYCIADEGTELQPKLQTLPKAAPPVIADQPTTASSGGDVGGSSHWAVGEAEPDPACVSCPAETTFVTFIANRVVMRDTFCPDPPPCDDEFCPPPPCQTTIRSCTGGSGLSPTKIGSYDCQTVFECVGTECPEENTSGACETTCGGDG